MLPTRSAAIPVVILSFLSTAAVADSLLLIPDTAADKVWAFSAYDGSVVSNAFIQIGRAHV